MGNFEQAVRAMRLDELQQIIALVEELYMLYGYWPTAAQVQNALQGKS